MSSRFSALSFEALADMIGAANQNVAQAKITLDDLAAELRSRAQPYAAGSEFEVHAFDGLALEIYSLDNDQKVN